METRTSKWKHRPYKGGAVGNHYEAVRAVITVSLSLILTLY